MCKYCKKLKELNDLDKKEYGKIVRMWRQRDYKARKIMSRLVDVYIDEFFGDKIFSATNKADIFSEVYKFVHSDWSGR